MAPSDMKLARLENAYRMAELAFVAAHKAHGRRGRCGELCDAAMADMTYAELTYLDALEVAAGGRPGGFRVEWSIPR